MGIRTRTPATHPGPLHPTLSFEDQRQRTNARKHAPLAMTIMSQRTLAVALLALIAFAAIADSVDAGRDLLHKGKHKKKMQKKKPPPPPKHKPPPPPVHYKPKYYHHPPPPPKHYKPKYYHPKKYYHHPPPPKHYSHSYSYSYGYGK